MCHQMEEHAYDFRGWRYAFVPGFNHGVGALLFKECEKLGHLRCPLEPRVTSEVNVVGVRAQAHTEQQSFTKKNLSNLDSSFFVHDCCSVFAWAL